MTKVRISQSLLSVMECYKKSNPNHSELVQGCQKTIYIETAIFATLQFVRK